MYPIVSALCVVAGIALTTSTVSAQSGSSNKVFEDLQQTAPKSEPGPIVNVVTPFDQLQTTAPRAPFDRIQDTSPRAPFDQIQDTAPRAPFDQIQDTAPRTDVPAANKN